MSETNRESRDVVVIGGGQSGLAGAHFLRRHELDYVVLDREPEPGALPDEVDGRALFEMATEKWKAEKEGRDYTPAGSLADIVMVPPVRRARDRGALEPRPMFTRFTTPAWSGRMASRRRWMRSSGAPDSARPWTT